MRSGALSLLGVAVIPKSLIQGQPLRLPGANFLGLEVERVGSEDERQAGLQDGVLLTQTDEREGVQDAVPELFVGARQDLVSEALLSDDPAPSLTVLLCALPELDGY